jgi:transcriptional regulator with XRE-family HTH domain
MNGLQYIRKDFGMTLAALGKKMGVSRQTISQWEQGTCPIPDSRLKELSNIFNLPEKYFKEVSEDDVDRLNELIVAVKSEQEESDWFTQYEKALNAEKEVLSKVDGYLKGKSKKFESVQELTDFILCEAKKVDEFTELLSNYKYPTIIQRILECLIHSENATPDYYDPFTTGLLLLLADERTRIDANRKEQIELHNLAQSETELY